MPQPQTEPEIVLLRRSTRQREPPRPYWIVRNAKQFRDVPRTQRGREASQDAGDDGSGQDTDDADVEPDLAGQAYVTFPEAFEYAHHTLTPPHLAKAESYPKTLAEALAREDGEHYYNAAVTEMEALLRNGTWELAKLPKGRNWHTLGVSY